MWVQDKQGGRISVYTTLLYIFYYIKVSVIPSGMKLIKKHDIMTCKDMISYIYHNLSDVSLCCKRFAWQIKCMDAHRHRHFNKTFKAYPLKFLSDTLSPNNSRNSFMPALWVWLQKYSSSVVWNYTQHIDYHIQLVTNVTPVCPCSLQHAGQSNK